MTDLSFRHRRLWSSRPPGTLVVLQAAVVALLVVVVNLQVVVDLLLVQVTL